jgi:hypothetical protein
LRDGCKHARDDQDEREDGADQGVHTRPPKGAALIGRPLCQSAREEASGHGRKVEEGMERVLRDETASTRERERDESEDRQDGRAECHRGVLVRSRASMLLGAGDAREVWWSDCECDSIHNGVLVVRGVVVEGPSSRG